ncbi:MAG: Integrase core domain protein [Methanoregula sp. PtaU1.Bin051]|nr:MAG: Integrase core domain protein [Methanoregula sp. PtaU1.Bin051]
MDQFSNPRELRGLKILSEPDTLRQINKNQWEVKSQSGNGFYQVSRKFISKDVYKWSCSCPDHTTRNVICKHIFAVQFSLKLKIDVETDSITQKVEMENAPSCPFCKSANVIKRGIRKTGYGEIQRYGCHDCNHRFVIDKGFSRVKYDPKVITLTLDLYFKGVSLRKITDHIQQFHDKKVCQTTPMRWIKKYTCLLGKYAEKYQAEVGNIWHSDETTIFIKKEGQKKCYEWIWNVMDAKTRYLLACQITETRYTHDARIPLKQAKKTANRRPDAIVTDGLQAYKKAIKAEFYDITAQIQNPHIRLNDFETKPNNNILERLNGTFRERTKVMRSLDSSVGAQEFVAGLQTYYNYIRPHQGIGGLTPAQVANIPINLMGNRWETMIGLAVK